MTFSMVDINARLMERANHITNRVMMDAAIDKTQSYLLQLLLNLNGLPHISTMCIGDAPKETLAAVTNHDSRSIINVIDYYLEIRTSCFNSHEEWVWWVDNVSEAVNSLTTAGSLLDDDLLSVLRDDRKASAVITANPWLVVPFAFSQISITNLSGLKAVLRKQ